MIMFTRRCPNCGSSRIERRPNDAPLLRRLVGIRQFLCLDCQGAFEGFVLVIAAGRSQEVRQEAHTPAGDRRRAPRVKARLPSRVSLLKSETGSLERQYFSLREGYTRDLSQTGLAVIFPSARRSDPHLAEERRRLDIILRLPTRPVQIYATAVRYENLSAQGAAAGCLIGAHITRMNHDDLVQYYDYLKKLG
jgi:hypothetical protein